MHLCVASILTKQTIYLRALPLVVLLSLMKAFVPTFIVSASMINAFSLGAKIQRKIASSLWSLGSVPSHLYYMTWELAISLRPGVLTPGIPGLSSA